MSDYLAKINEIVEEHRNIRGSVKLVGDSVSDQEALNSLKSVRSDWPPDRLDLLSEKQNRLRQTMGLLEEGLRNHFAKEEEVLPPLLGEFLMQALRSEHQDIVKAIRSAQAVVIDTELGGLSQEELTAKDSELKQVVSNLGQLIGGHADREEQMLEMVERALHEGK